MHRARELALHLFPGQQTCPDHGRGTKKTPSMFSQALPFPRPASSGSGAPG
jgi:hypothetical protein